MKIKKKIRLLKILIISVHLVALSLNSLAQQSIHGRVLDENKEAVGYATVALLHPEDSTLKYFGVTNASGIYQIKNIKAGEYMMQFSFVGKEIIYEKVIIQSGKESDFGDKIMKAMTLEEVEVVAEYIPITFKNDTVEFNAKAFETKPQDNTEELLKKIPGIEVDETGEIKAMGKDVEKVLVDGKEFFGKDHKVATKNIPADAIEKVQVYDKRSEEAVFMGIDDGVRERTINLLLNEDHKKGYFGNAEIGGGYSDFYTASAKVYRFSSKFQSAVLGMYNNINDFAYTSRGYDHWGQRHDGISTTGAGGMNVSYNIDKFNRYFISYLASSTKTDLEKNTSMENFLQDGSYFQFQELQKEEKETPHKINFGIRRNFNKKHNVIVDGDLALSANSALNQLSSKTIIYDTLINQLNSYTENRQGQATAFAKAVYIAKLNKGKTQLKTNVSSHYVKSASELAFLNTTTRYNPFDISDIDQFQDNETEKSDISINPAVVHELKKHWHMSANIDMGISQDKLLRAHGNANDNIIFDTLGADFKVNNTAVYPALSLKKGNENKQLNFTLGAAWNRLENNWPGSMSLSNTSLHFLPGFSFENSYRTGRRISLRYNTSVTMPSSQQLLPVTNTINPLFLYRGNIELEPEYNHNLNFHWAVFDQFSFTSLFSRMGAGYTLNKIGSSRIINPDYSQLVMPVNVPYAYNLYSFVYFSTPLRPLGINIKIRSHEMWKRGINIINEEENINTNTTHSLKISLENRNKKKWGVNLGGAMSLTNSKFSIAESMNNVYYNTSYFADARYTPGSKWNFKIEGNVVNYNSKSFTESISIPILNASITYYFLKGEKASLSVRGYDLLNRSLHISQVTDGNFLVREESNMIGQYIMLLFKIKIGKQ